MSGFDHLGAEATKEERKRTVITVLIGAGIGIVGGYFLAKAAMNWQMKQEMRPRRARFLPGPEVRPKYAAVKVPTPQFYDDPTWWDDFSQIPTRGRYA